MFVNMTLGDGRESFSAQRDSMNVRSHENPAAPPRINSAGSVPTMKSLTCPI
jgi:hypothetical protein